jgi:hypothetical protein
MALQIRRGSTADRLAYTPEVGELIFDTTTKVLYVGDGSQVGGIASTSLTADDAQDAAAELFTNGSHTGISFTYNDSLGTINAVVSSSGNFIGSVFADDSTMLVDGTNGTIVGNIVSERLEIVGASILETTSGKKWSIQTSVYHGSSANDWGQFKQAHNTADANNVAFSRSRGSLDIPTSVTNGDRLMVLSALGHDGTGFRTGASISAEVEGAVSSSTIPTKIVFKTRATTSNTTKAEISPTGVLKVNNIQALSGTLTVTGTVVGKLDGDVTGSVFADDSTKIIDGTNGGAITAPSVTASNYLKLPVFATVSGRNSAIPSPTAGMMVYVSNDGTGSAAVQVYFGSPVSSWTNIS